MLWSIHHHRRCHLCKIVNPPLPLQPPQTPTHPIIFFSSTSSLENIIQQYCNTDLIQSIKTSSFLLHWVLKTCSAAKFLLNKTQQTTTKLAELIWFVTTVHQHEKKLRFQPWPMTNCKIYKKLFNIKKNNRFKWMVCWFYDMSTLLGSLMLKSVFSSSNHMLSNNHL